MPSSNLIKAFIVEGVDLLPGIIVKKGAADRGIVICGDDEEAIGVNQGSDDTTAVIVGDHADIMIEGEGKILLGATLGAGDNVACDAAGKAKALPTTAATTFFRVGRLLEGGISGDMVDIRLTNDFLTNPA